MARETLRPVSGTSSPAIAGASTFVRLPELRDVERTDVAILGIPFDSGVSYRPGARFGPSAVRQASRLLRPQFHPAYDMEPLAELQAVDAGDVACNPFDIDEAISQIERRVDELQEVASAIVSIGGDHTIVLPILRSMHRRHGQVALVHFDAHLDTWDTYFGAPYTHGTLLRRAAGGGPVQRRRIDARRDPRPALRATGHGRRRRLRVPHDPMRRRAASRDRWRRGGDPRAGG